MNELAAYSTVAMTLGLVVTRPRVGPTFRVTPALAAFAGVLFLTAIGVVTPAHVGSAVTQLWSPFVAIGSIMVMTEVADRVGLLAWWSARIEARATSTHSLFLLVFALGVVTSASLNNDAAILLLTPVVVALVRRRFPGRPHVILPFAFAVFVSAGVAALPVSNPMNMVVSELAGIRFGEYVMRMAPVAAAGWICGFVVLRLLFARQLAVPIAAGGARREPSTPAQRRMMLLLGVVLVSYPVVGYLGGQVVGVAAAGAALSLVVARGAGLRPARLALRGVSWETLAFLLCALVMSLGLRDVGLVERLASLYRDNGLGVIGVGSALGSAVLNNHPMSHLNLMALSADGPAQHGRVLAALIGGDLGPRLLPMGSLAGLLWLEMLRRHGVEIGVGRFVRVGVLVGAPTLAASLALLALIG